MLTEAALTSCAVSFLYIFLKSTQQLNVVSGRYWLVWPVSIGMGLCEATILIYVVKANSVWVGAANGIGGGAGAMVGMLLHSYMKRRRVTLVK